MKYAWALVQTSLSSAFICSAPSASTPLASASTKSRATRKSSVSDSAYGTNVLGNSSSRCSRPSLSPPASSSSKKVLTAMPRPMSGSCWKGRLSHVSIVGREMNGDPYRRLISSWSSLSRLDCPYKNIEATIASIKSRSASLTAEANDQKLRRLLLRGPV